MKTSLEVVYRVSISSTKWRRHFCSPRQVSAAQLSNMPLTHSASAEGSIRIWRGYDVEGQADLASAFRAVSDVHPVGHTSGVLTAWEQQKGHLLVGGDMKVVRVWDANVERHVQVGVSVDQAWLLLIRFRTSQRRPGPI